MKLELSFDRLEGSRKETAVLVTDDGGQINFPKALLPKGAKPGDVLVFDITRDAGATQRLKGDTKALQDELKKRDTGGDVTL